MDRSTLDLHLVFPIFNRNTGTRAQIEGRLGIGTSLGATGIGISFLQKSATLAKATGELIPGFGRAVAAVATAYDVGSALYAYGSCGGWW